MNQIVIEVRGGIIQNICTSQKSKIAVIDYDNDPKGEVKFYEPDLVSEKLSPIYEPGIAKALQKGGLK